MFHNQDLSMPVNKSYLKCFVYQIIITTTTIIIICSKRITLEKGGRRAVETSGKIKTVITQEVVYFWTPMLLLFTLFLLLVKAWTLNVS